MRPACTAFVDDFPVHIGTLADALADDQLLLGVIVAATTGDEQRLKRLRGLSCKHAGDSVQEEDSNEFHFEYYL